MTGILHYTTTTKGIGGVIKRRISDFLVHEIPLDRTQLQNRAFGEWEGVKEQELSIPKKDGQYLHITMEKFNLDTNEALRRVSRALYMSPKRIGYAGMKDKRAITSQRISIWNPEVERLKNFKSRYVALYDPLWKDEKIEIGNLQGNEFEITIREIPLAENELQKITEQCFLQMQKGVANYFGEQRFGGIRQITHRVGKEFILGNFEKAVMLYLTSPSEGEEEEIAIARKNLADTKDFARATKEFPTKFRYERAILHHLCKFPKDFIGAFQNLPRHLTYMFTHAYQSYLFNQIINTRIERGIGVTKTEGDILEDGIATAALFGFDSTLASATSGEIEKEVLEKESIELAQFKVKSFPELSCRGSRKKIALIPQNLKIVEISPDEFCEGKLKQKISFSLDKGNYATTVLRELMKNG